MTFLIIIGLCVIFYTLLIAYIIRKYFYTCCIKQIPTPPDIQKTQHNTTESPIENITIRNTISPTSSLRTTHTGILFVKRISELSNGTIDIDNNTTCNFYLKAKNNHTSPSNVITQNDVGIANGVCELDNNGLVPLYRLPGGLLHYKGQWSAINNTPTLSNPDTSKKGYVYYVSDSYNRFNINWEQGDWLVYNYDGYVERRPNTYNTDVRTVFFNGCYTYIPVNTSARLFIGYSANVYKVTVYSSNGNATCNFEIKKNNISMVGSGTKPYLNNEIMRTITTDDWNDTSVSNGDYVDVIVNQNTNATDVYVVLYTLITE